MAEAFRVYAELPNGLSYPNFDKKAVKKEMRRAIAPLRKVSRKMVARKATSSAGQFPGRQTGALYNAIDVRTSKSGFSVSLFENPKKLTYSVKGADGKRSKVGRKDGKYYPAFVLYGHRAPHTETFMQARQHKKRAGKKVAAPRKNWILEATKDFGEKEWPKVSQRILENGIKPVFAK